jgi:hypothetical protein
MTERSQNLLSGFAQENRQPRLGRELLRLLSRAGFSKVRSIAKVVQPPYTMFRRSWEGRLRSLDKSSPVSVEEMTRWIESLEQADAKGILSQGVIVFTVCGQKP